jgi:hypothetical protein
MATKVSSLATKKTVHVYDRKTEVVDSLDFRQKTRKLLINAP